MLYAREIVPDPVGTLLGSLQSRALVMTLDAETLTRGVQWVSVSFT